MAALTAGIGLAAGVVAATGVFARGDGTSVEVTSMRGETYRMLTTGVYAWNAERVVVEGVGWDMFTLYVVAPATLLVAAFLARGSFRARIVALGLLAYLFYQYLMYSVTWAFGPLFLPFVVVYAASAAAIAWIAASVARDVTPERFSRRFPRRAMATLSIVVSVVISAMWLRRIGAGLRGDASGAMLFGQTTMTVQALDLGIIVPLAVFTAVTTLARRPIGYVLASVIAVKAFAMASAICAMLIMAARVEGRLELALFVFFLGTALVALGLELRILTTTSERTAATSFGRPPPRDLLTT